MNNFTDKYQNCRLCPRDCGVNRFEGAGFCGEGAQLRLAFAGLHRGEEPPLSGKGGSGTIFVSGCNLRCVICQNWQISGGGGVSHSDSHLLGRAVTTGEFSAVCLALQNAGAENINIVTGSHAVPAIVEGLCAAKAAGLKLPVLWNSSGYENPETLELLEDHIDTWLPDLKTPDSGLAERLFNAPDYPRVAARAILRMMRFCREKKPGPAGRVIIRHLILPGRLESTRTVLRWFADNAAGNNALLSLMSQYTPIKLLSAGTASGGRAPGGLGPPKRFLNRREYETVLGWLGEFGIEDGFCQELVKANGHRNDWLPDFIKKNPFSSKLSLPVWHFSDGIPD